MHSFPVCSHTPVRALGESRENWGTEVKTVAGSAGLATNFTLCEDVYLRKITLFTQSFALQPSGVDLSVKARLLINCGAW